MIIKVHNKLQDCFYLVWKFLPYESIVQSVNVIR